MRPKKSRKNPNPSRKTLTSFFFREKKQAAPATNNNVGAGTWESTTREWRSLWKLPKRPKNQLIPKIAFFSRSICDASQAKHKLRMLFFDWSQSPKKKLSLSTKLENPIEYFRCYKLHGKLHEFWQHRLEFISYTFNWRLCKKKFSDSIIWSIDVGLQGKQKWER